VFGPVFVVWTADVVGLAKFLLSRETRVRTGVSLRGCRVVVVRTKPAVGVEASCISDSRFVLSLKQTAESK